MSISQSAHQILDQLEMVVAQFSEKNYVEPIEILGHSSIGQHVRHTLEFFICLMDAKNHKIINYDNRRHDQLIESDPTLTLSVIRSIKGFINKGYEDFPLTLQANYQFEGDEQLSIQSNYYRELAYNIEHAIHHMALIKIAVRSNFTSVQLPDHFGIASSTVRYQNSH